MQHISLLILFVLLYGFISAQPVSAKIFINEFSSAESEDWIELYNDGDEDVSLSGYHLQDSTESHKKDLEGTVGGHGFTVIEWNWLNVGEDTIRLFSNSTPVDEISYGTSSLPSPNKEQSAGRSEDGQISWSIFSSHSKGSSNSEGELYTPPDPTSTHTPTSTKTPTPSRTPTPKKTPTETKTPTSVRVSVPFISKIESDISILPTGRELDSSEAAVLGLEDSDRISATTQSKKPTSVKNEVQTLGSEYSKTGVFAVITAGVLLISSCGILIFRKYRYLIFTKLIWKNKM